LTIDAPSAERQRRADAAKQRNTEGTEAGARRPLRGGGDTPRVLYGCENKGVAGKGICKVMKTKGRAKGDLECLLEREGRW
jgi:hypothetical protein